MTTETAVIRAKENSTGLLSQLPQGERHPGERVLVEDFGVCRVTLRRAVNDPISDEKLERRARPGTYVKRPMISSESRLKSFTREIQERGQHPSTKLILFECVKANKNVPKQLSIREREEIFVITRLRFVDEILVAIETLKISCRAMPTFTDKDLLGSLYDTFADRFAIRITNARASIKVHFLSEREQELLQIKSDVPCLIIKMLDRDQNDNPLMTAECIYRSDSYELQIPVIANMPELGSIDTKRVS